MNKKVGVGGRRQEEVDGFVFRHKYGVIVRHLNGDVHQAFGASETELKRGGRAKKKTVEVEGTQER